MDKTYLNNADCLERAEHIYDTLSIDARANNRTLIATKIYGIPRGGVPVAYLVKACAPRLGGLIITVVDDPVDAHFFVDDIIDSGATADSFYEHYGKKTLALVDKKRNKEDTLLGWVVFPWETDGADSEEGVEENFKRVLQYYTPDSSRGGLVETPARVAKAWKYWTSGYDEDAKSILKVFEDGADDYDEMVIVKDIPIYSKCEHHLADIFGTCTIAYIPNGKIVGLSKLSRLANMYAKRLQVQERLTVQIADAINEHLQPQGVGVIIKARHMCMESRGICQQGHHTITSALRGVIKEEHEARSEFMLLSK